MCEVTRKQDELTGILLFPQMTSVERVVEYTELKSEAPWETEKRPPPDWPNRGLLTFDHVNFSYSPDGPLVLKDISATFQPSEKVRPPQSAF